MPPVFRGSASRERGGERRGKERTGRGGEGRKGDRKRGKGRGVEGGSSYFALGRKKKSRRLCH